MFGVCSFFILGGFILWSFLVILHLNSNRLILTFLFHTNLNTSFLYYKAKAEFKKSVATINTVNYKIQPNSNTVIANDNNQYNYLHHVILIVILILILLLLLVIDKDTKRMGKTLYSLTVTIL